MMNLINVRQGSEHGSLDALVNNGHSILSLLSCSLQDLVSGGLYYIWPIYNRAFMIQASFYICVV